VASLDDKLSRWLPELPNADKITLGMLAASHSGYSDYVQNPDFLKANNADPFRAWNRDELRQYGISKPLQYTPGTSWNSAHTNFLILGEALEKIIGKPIDRLVADEALRPLGLRNTQSSCTAEIPEPVLHAFTSERGIYEDSTYWDPSCTLGCGLVETTDISDLITSAVGIGTGSLLSRTSLQLQIEPKSRIIPANGPPVYYGLGIFTANSWVFQYPLFSGYQAIMAYQSSQQIAIAVAATVGPHGSASTNYSTEIFQKVGAYLAPNQPPPSQ
jgi:CubicO group peptidase (beta-lactamase class C family)